MPGSEQPRKHDTEYGGTNFAILAGAKSQRDKILSFVSKTEILVEADLVAIQILDQSATSKMR